jgi:tetratricopeptide (TPR) repeat protein
MIFYIESDRTYNFKKESVNFASELIKPLEKRIENRKTEYMINRQVLVKIYEINYLYTKNQEMLSSAESVLLKALAFNNQTPSLYRLMARIKMLEKNYIEAEDYYKRAYKLGPQNDETKIDFYKTLGKSYYFLADDKEEAAKNFKKAIDLAFLKYQANPARFSELTQDNENEALFWEKTARIFCKDLKDEKTCYEIYEKEMTAFPQYKKFLEANLKQLKAESR